MSLEVLRPREIFAGGEIARSAISLGLLVGSTEGIPIYCTHMNIAESWSKIKHLPLQDAATPILVILVGLGSFGLGRMSVLEASKTPISISQAAASAIPAGGQVVASKSGNKYHYPWCAGAGAISEKNKITFESNEKARAAGYLPAGNCKGLE